MGWGSCWGSQLTGHLPWPPEPGYYRDGEFGIRIEDVALVVEAQTKVAQWGWAGEGGTAPGGLHQVRGGGRHAPPVGLGAPNASSLRQHQTGEKPFLTFEVVSLVPYDRNLIDLSLLSLEQVWGARGRGAELGCGAGVRGEQRGLRKWT